MSDLFTVYSPAGEKFEVTRANFRDLTTHAGWTQNPPVATEHRVPEATPAPTPAPAAPEAPVAPVTAAEGTETTETTDAGTDNATHSENADQDGAGDAEEATDPAPKAKLTPEDFADLPEKADVDAYIKETFGFNADGRWNRDKLVAKAIELAKALA